MFSEKNIRKDYYMSWVGRQQDYTYTLKTLEKNEFSGESEIILRNKLEPLTKNDCRKLYEL